MTETQHVPAPKRVLPLHWKMAIGFVGGLLLGLLVYSMDLAGADVFLR